MTDAELSARMRENILLFKRLQAARSPLRHFTAPDVHAFALPLQPGYLHQQLVLYTNVSALAAALGALEDFYRSHAIPAWRVSVPEGDTEAPRLLASAGYQPELFVPVFASVLEGADLVPPSCPLERPALLETLVALNEEAFGLRMDYLAGWGRQSPAPLHVLEVREEGRRLAGGLALDAGDTAGVYLVATATSARRRGLASEVMRGLMWDARARGRAAVVLQSTPMGCALYQHLRFREVDRWTNWVKRPSP